MEKSRHLEWRLFLSANWMIANAICIDEVVAMNLD